MLDRDVLARDIKNCINEVPVTVRHRGRQFTARLNSTEDVMQTLDGGLRDNMAIQIIAAKQDFGSAPKSMDSFYILSNGKWVKLQVRSVPDFYDQISASYTINLQSPDKGIE